jgi:hypothetical protein
MVIGRPRLSAVEHFRNGTYRRSRHGPLPWDKAEPEAETPPVDDDSVWKHELRLPREGETMTDVLRKAAEYRERTGVSLTEIMARDRR